ncbi:MAG: molecular chaperone DnaJ [Candidatus Levybacteria bacterium CG10_big_fil_rev_8_21_14_0_10_35_13]|nr:MAG: molecular chaperone DnaJ [Candidatus Levybacteria bacterium CG10_big_fil_rev_8_21_14_0_10_35_13]
MVMAKDYYSILGISKNATDADIKKAYRKLALEHHPDRNKGDKESEEKFKEVTKAYEVLSDSNKRKTYDQFGETAFDPSAGSGPFGQGFGGQQGPFTYTYSSSGGNFDFGGFSDPFEIFEQFFGGANPFSRAQARSVYSLTISFMDAVNGATKKVNMGGKTQTIKIPAGVDDGSRIRFGEADVIIDVTPHSKFKRQGYDIVTEEDLSFPKAALGDEIDVETVQGKVKIKIPQGTQPDTLIRLRGKGVKMLRGAGHGDHYVRIKVVVPKNLTGHQKELLKEFDGKPQKSGWF